MAAAGAAGNGEKSGFRWLDLARYAVAAVVTAVIIAVVVHAIKVVFRPDTLTLSVVGGSVYTILSPPPAREQPSLTLSLDLRARNPSGRVHMYYVNISVYLFNRSTPETTPAPLDDSFVAFKLKDMSVMQMYFVDTMKQLTVQRNSAGITPFAFDALHKTGGSIEDVTMRVNGTLVTEIRSGFNTSQVVSYYCRQLVVGLHDDDATMKTQETSCTIS